MHMTCLQPIEHLDDFVRRQSARSSVPHVWTLEGITFRYLCVDIKESLLMILISTTLLVVLTLSSFDTRLPPFSIGIRNSIRSFISHRSVVITMFKDTGGAGRPSSSPHR